MSLRLAGITGATTVCLVASTSFASYIDGYSWDYKSLFGTDSSQKGLSAADSEGNRTYQYCWSWVDGTPDSSALMGAYFSWTDNGWRYSGSENWKTAIYNNKITAGLRWNGSQMKGEAAQIVWTAPVAGYYSISITANNITKDNYSTKESLWIKDMTTPVSVDTSPLTSWSYQSQTAVWLNSGEKVVFWFSPWGSNTATIADFTMDVTKVAVPEASALSLLALGPTLLICGRKR